MVILILASVAIGTKVGGLMEQIQRRIFLAIKIKSFHYAE